MLLCEVVEASARVAATPARSAKTAALADLLRRLDPDEVEPAVGFLVGEPRQGRIGVGWATLAKRVAARRDVPSAGPFAPPPASGNGSSRKTGTIRSEIRAALRQAGATSRAGRRSGRQARARVGLAPSQGRRAAGWLREAEILIVMNVPPVTAHRTLTASKRARSAVPSQPEQPDRGGEARPGPV
jgi:hypothetical protein